MISACHCGSRGPDNPCDKPMTQEDGLCDGCRVNYCVAQGWLPRQLPEYPKFVKQPDGSTLVYFQDAQLVVNSKLWSTE